MDVKIDRDAIISNYTKFGQEHVFAFFHKLNLSKQNKLLTQAASIDLAHLVKLKETYIDSTHNNFFQGRLSPAEIIRIPHNEEEQQRMDSARKIGEKTLRDGKVAAMVVAGGQASRLGYPHPKGMYPAGPISGKSLFQMHCDKIQALNARFATNIPFLVMTSESNFNETVSYFEDNNYFNLKKENVHFFTQGLIPALDEKGKLILDAKDHIFMNPDGHGGSLRALKKSGVLDAMKDRGIELISYFQVDNVLIQICDPVFLGYHLQNNAEMSAKVVNKNNALEKVGVVGLEDGKLKVIEYSDMPEDALNSHEPDGSLTYWAGSIAIHIFNTDFIERENQSGLNLPFHVAHKKIPYVNEDGTHVTPDQPNGYKFEQFVFDALPDARAAAIMEVVREDEFSPIKNKTGDDSAATAKRDLVRKFSRWLEHAGVHVPRDAKGEPKFLVEIDPLYAWDAEELASNLPQQLSIKENLYLKTD